MGPVAAFVITVGRGMGCLEEEGTAGGAGDGADRGFDGEATI